VDFVAGELRIRRWQGPFNCGGRRIQDALWPWPLS
jgi:hypothetical protein